MSEFLSHPFVLAIFGSVVTVFFTGFLIPDLTRGWQDHQKELDLKTALVSDVSSSATKIIIAIQIHEVRYRRQAQVSVPDVASLDNAYRTWQVNSEITRSRLQSYFPGTLIGQHWSLYATLITKLYVISDCSYPSRVQYVRDIRVGLAQLARLSSTSGNRLTSAVSPEGWNVLSSQCSLPLYRSTPFYTNWFNLRDLLLLQQDAIVQEILNAHIVAY